MKLVTFRWGDRRRVGRIVGEQEVQPLALADAQRGALALIETLSRGEPLPRDEGPRLALAAVTLEAPLPRPRRNVFCVGRNYREHAKELERTLFANDAAAAAGDAWPMVFSKLPECVVGPHDEVRLPSHVSTQIDYESELAVVIGRGGRDIARSRALDHVFGYTIVNDVTARDVQARHKQWHLGKSFDGFCPMGPCVATPDACDGTATRVRGWVNGELRQDGYTRDLIFDIPSLIETCSRGITLYPGDVIATGTPAGVGMGMTPPCWLKAGDVVRIEIDGIGAIENRFV